MEYVPGEVLRTRIRRERILDLRRSIQIGVQICEALAALHDAGIIHRDLKPENILLGEGPSGGPPVVKLFDFGVVKFLPADRAADLEADGRPGTFVGTPRYMAPEQAAGSGVDHRADLFALGVMLFEMITGRCPHEGDSLRDVVMAKLKGAPRITVNPEQEILPQELTDIVDRCLQLKPSLRPRDARQVASALRDAEVVLFTVGSMRATPQGTAVRMLAELTGEGGAVPGRAESPASAARAVEGGGPGPADAASPAPPVAPAGPPSDPVPSRGAGAPSSGLRGRHLVLAIVTAVALAVLARWYFDGREPVVMVPATLNDGFEGAGEGTVTPTRAPAGAAAGPRSPESPGHVTVSASGGD
jgi:serine/threonine-protein kinase